MDLDFPTYTQPRIDRVTGAGERNSTLTCVDACGLSQMEGKPANLQDSIGGFIPHILEPFVSLTFFFFEP